MKNNRTILVTGCAGFIGSHLTDELLEAGYRVIGYDAFTYAGKESNLKKANGYSTFTLVRGDINDSLLLSSTVKKYSVDCIINLAAETHVDNSIKSSDVFLKTNIMGVKTILDICRETSCLLVHFSTDEVYGHLELNETPFTETTRLNPRSPYSATKASADLLVLSYVNTYGINACITRCSNNFGENQHEEKLIPKIVKNILENKKIPIYGKGENIRDWIYVEDHIDGIEKVLLKGKSGEVYNFGGNSEITNIELCKQILSMMGKKTSVIEFVNDRPGHDFRYSIDYTKATKQLNWNPKYTLEKLKDVIESLTKRFKESEE